jgi:hypothetical protein
MNSRSHTVIATAILRRAAPASVRNRSRGRFIGLRAALNILERRDGSRLVQTNVIGVPWFEVVPNGGRVRLEDARAIIEHGNIAVADAGLIDVPQSWQWRR